MEDGTSSRIDRRMSQARLSTANSAVCGWLYKLVSIVNHQLAPSLSLVVVVQLLIVRAKLITSPLACRPHDAPLSLCVSLISDLCCLISSLVLHTHTLSPNTLAHTHTGCKSHEGKKKEGWQYFYFVLDGWQLRYYTGQSCKVSSFLSSSHPLIPSSL